MAIAPGSDIQAAVNAYPGGTAFCLKAGVHYRTSAITPKSGNTFTGEYGAVIDGSKWSTTDQNQGLFRSHNQNIDDVVIRNLVIRSSPQRGIHAFKDYSDRWTVEHNEIVGNRVGISHANYFVIRRNVVRHNWQYGIASFNSMGSLIEDNEFSWNAARSSEFPGNSGNSKWAAGVTNTVVRGNLVADNRNAGIWFDGRHSGITIEGNSVHRNGANGIFTEVGGSTVIRNNLVTGHHRGIYISESHDTTVVGNTVTGNDRAIWMFQDGSRVAESQLANNLVNSNSISVPPTPVVAGVAPLATGLNCSNLTASQCAAYSTSKGNSFQGNAYTVPSSTRWWNWENNLRSWTEWRAAGQDTTGTLKIG